MDENKDSQNPIQNQNPNQQPNNSYNYDQYLDLNPQNNRKKKAVLVILIIVVLALITGGIVWALSGSSDQTNNTGQSGDTSAGAEDNVPVCEDEDCFRENFAQCQPASYESFEGNAYAKYEISAEKDVGCPVKLTYTSEDQSIVSREMTCYFDNELDFDEAASLVFKSPDAYGCEGDLLDYL